MKKEIPVSHRVDEQGNKYYYVDIGDEGHGKPSFRLWISAKLIIKDERGIEIIKFPVKDAKIFKTEKGTLILKPNQGTTVHYLFVQCGFRGGSSFKILEPAEHEIYRFYEYESPRGSLGMSTGALVVVNSNQIVKYKWSKSGRLYGKQPTGINIILPTGEEKAFEGIEDLEELKREIQ